MIFATWIFHLNLSRHTTRTASLHATVAALAVAHLSGPAHANTNVDSVGSSFWPTTQQKMFGATRVAFDSRIGITGPAFTEDVMQVPVALDTSAPGRVEHIVVAVDHNPICKVLEFAPVHVRPALSFWFKL